MTTPPDAAALLAATHAELARMPGILAGLVAGLDDAAWRARPAPAEWAPVEILCHLRDEETEDFGARVRVIAKRGKRFALIDPVRWAVERRYLEDNGPGALAAFRERRTASLAFLDTLKPEKLTAAAPLGRTGPLSGLDLLAAWWPTTACIPRSSRARWRAGGPDAGRRCGRNTPGRFPIRPPDAYPTDAAKILR